MKFFTVPSKPHFKVNIQGDIMNAKTGNILKPFRDRDGYLRISLRVKDKTFHIAPHRAVAEVFVKNPKPQEFLIVNHINSKRDDNRPENLEWVNPKLNRQHCQVSGNHNRVGSAHNQAILNEDQVTCICERLSKSERAVDIAKDYGVSRHVIYAILKGDSWTHVSKKYKFYAKKSKTISTSTIEWVKHQIEMGRDDESILSVAKKIDGRKLKKIKHIIATCND